MDYEKTPLEASTDLHASVNGNGNAPSGEDCYPTHAKVNFSDLPFEIRTGIYKLAIPLSRVLRMRLVTNPDSSDIYAESTSAPCIPTILHINHEARTIGLSIFKLSFGAYPNGDKGARVTYWNPRIDTLYLPYQNPSREHPVQTTKDFGYRLDDYQEYEPAQDRDSCFIGSELYHTQSILQHVQHIALPVNRKTRVGFSNISEYYDDEDEIYKKDLPAWLKGFQRLESVTMLDDPFPQWYRAGEILLHEPEGESRSFQCFQETEDVYALGLENFAKEKGWEGELPSLEMLIMTNRKTRKAPAFCIRPRKRSVFVVQRG